LQLIKINVYICEVEIKTKKMAHEKTEKNPKKAGRPRLEPTVTVSVRIPKKMKEEISARFGNRWMVLFREFVRVYMEEK
jgi:uncharacterized protein (DUF4415 family)